MGWLPHLNFLFDLFATFVCMDSRLKDKGGAHDMTIGSRSGTRNTGVPGLILIFAIFDLVVGLLC